jgi:hypothetical protein
LLGERGLAGLGVAAGPGDELELPVPVVAAGGVVVLLAVLSFMP